MIVVLGSINVDIRFEVERLPKAGETVHAINRRYFAGGKGANQALAARRAGADVALFGAAGNDRHAERALSELVAAGVLVSDVTTVPEETGSANIYVDSQGENVIVVTSGANGLVDAEMAARAVSRTKGGFLVLQQEIPTGTTKAALELARAADVTTILNVSPFGGTSSELSEMADIVIANEREWSHLGGKGDILASMRERSLRQRQTLVVTRGPLGVCVASPTDYFEIQAPAIRPLDTVGAGDTFCGYFAATLAHGGSLRDAADIAVRAASIACLKAGAQASIPAKSEVEGAVQCG